MTPFKVVDEDSREQVNPREAPRDILCHLQRYESMEEERLEWRKDADLVVMCRAAVAVDQPSSLVLCAITAVLSDSL